MNNWETEYSRCEYVKGEPGECKALRWDRNSEPLNIHFDLGFDRIESEPQQHSRTKPNLAEVNRKIVKKRIVKNSQIENNNKW